LKVLSVFDVSRASWHEVDWLCRMLVRDGYEILGFDVRDGEVRLVAKRLFVTFGYETIKGIVKCRVSMLKNPTQKDRNVMVGETRKQGNTSITNNQKRRDK